MSFLDPVNSFSGILPANGMATPALLAQRRKLAEAMLQQGTDSSPIASPWQGAARLMQAYVGGNMMNKANQQEIQGRQDAAAKLGAAMSSDKPDYASALSNPWIDPSTVVSMANSNRDFGLRKEEFAQTKLQQDREFIQQGFRPMPDGTFYNIATGEVRDPMGRTVNAPSQSQPSQITQTPITDPNTQAQPIPQPIAPTGPQVGGGATAPVGAGLLTPPAVAAPIAPAVAAGAARGQPDNAYAKNVAWLRSQGMEVNGANLDKAAMANAADPSMSTADFAQGKAYRDEVTQNPDYAAYQSGLGSLNSMTAAQGDTPAANAAFLHSFAETLAPGKVLKSPNGTIQFVPDSPENFAAALKKAESYLDGNGYLSPQAKKEMLDQAYGTVGTYKQRYDALMASEGGVAKNAGVHLDKVVPGLGDLPARAVETPPAPDNSAPAPKVLIFNPKTRKIE